jgi:hypothetical protein
MVGRVSLSRACGDPLTAVPILPSDFLAPEFRILDSSQNCHAGIFSWKWKMR